jgi:hypothetical protein
LDVGTFSPRHIPAFQPANLTFTANFNIPFFIRVGYNNPLLGEMQPAPPRTVKLPGLEPGDFQVYVSYNGMDWKEIDHLIVDPPPGTSEIASETVTQGDDWRHGITKGLAIGLVGGTVVAVIAVYLWDLHVKRQRRKRQRRSDEPIRHRPAI